MRITDIETIPYAIPYAKPVRFASGEVRTADHVLVRIHTDAGVVGVAEAPPRPYTYGETQESIVAAIRRLLAPQLVGLAATQRERAQAAMQRTVGNPTAKAAIDMAMWDIVGKAAGIGVSELLGGCADRMRVCHMVGFGPVAEMVDDAERARAEHGITAFKVKVGRRPHGQDVEACRVLREKLGDDVELYVDGNRGWSPSEAAEALRAMDGLRITFAEEPCPADDVLGRRWLAERVPMPVVADESATDPAEVTRELLGGAASAISIKTARTGFTVSQRIAGQCAGMGAEVMIGNQLDAQLGTLCSLALGAALQTTCRRAGELSNFLAMSDDLLAQPLRIAGGELRVPDAPGIGAEIDPDKLAHYRQD